MKDRERHYAKLLWSYPKAYRHERGGEVLGTLLESSQKAGNRPAIRDLISVASHGMRMRLALTGDRVVRPVLRWLLALVTSTLALGLLFIFGDLLITGITSGNFYRYESMTIALILFSGVGYLAVRSLRRIWPRRDVRIRSRTQIHSQN